MHDFSHVTAGGKKKANEREQVEEEKTAKAREDGKR